jgi:hypothetical protein
MDNAIFNKNCTMDRAILPKPPKNIPRVSPQISPQNSNSLRLPNIQKVKINKDSVDIFTIVKFT